MVKAITSGETGILMMDNGMMDFVKEWVYGIVTLERYMKVSGLRAKLLVKVLWCGLMEINTKVVGETVRNKAKVRTPMQKATVLLVNMMMDFLTATGNTIGMMEASIEVVSKRDINMDRVSCLGNIK